MIKHNYHTHTIRCNHSSLTARDAIENGIKIGLETIGFSEHIYFPDCVDNYRLSDEKDFNEYISELKSLREEYKDKIKVIIGIESEIFNPYSKELLVNHIDNVLKHEDISYVILGHHNYCTGRSIFDVTPTKKELEEYVKHWKIAIEKTNILYIAHPDGFLKGTKCWTKVLRDASKEMIDFAVKHDVPLGINVNGLLYNLDFCYPNLEYFKMVADAGGKVVVELDAHSKNAFKVENIKKVYEIARMAGVKIINKIL